jgi:hypothetical protein
VTRAPDAFTKPRILSYQGIGLALLLFFIGCLKLIRWEGNVGYIKGEIHDLEGNPVEDAQIYVYKWLFNEMLYEEILRQEIDVFDPKHINNEGPYQGPPDFKSAKTGADGKYQIALPVGTYCMVARKQRNRDLVQGPTNPVDLSSLVSEPIVVVQGETVRISLRLLNTFWDASRFNQYLVRTYLTGISGRVFSSEGIPISDVIITANGEASQARRKPDFVSFPTDEDGNYALYVFFENVYHLGIKRNMRGPYLPFHLKYDPGKWSVSIYQGEITSGVDLILEGEATSLD